MSINWSTSAPSCPLQGRAALSLSGHPVKCRLWVSRSGVHFNKLPGEVMATGSKISPEKPSVCEHLLLVSLASIHPSLLPPSIHVILGKLIPLSSCFLARSIFHLVPGTTVTVHKWTWSLFPAWSSGSFGNSVTQTCFFWMVDVRLWLW